MVMPLVDEHKPRCYVCGERFDDIAGLRGHRGGGRCGGAGGGQQGPAPGDVTMF